MSQNLIIIEIAGFAFHCTFPYAYIFRWVSGAKDAQVYSESKQSLIDCIPVD